MLPMLESSKRILDELSNVLPDHQLCEIFNITTAELGLLHFTVSYRTRHRALLLGSLCPASCCPYLAPQTGIPGLGRASRDYGSGRDEVIASAQAVRPWCPALSCQRSQELQGAGSPAAFAWLSLLLLFQVMNPTEENLQELHNPVWLRQLLKIESRLLLWLVFRSLALLSKSSEMVSRT